VTMQNRFGLKDFVLFVLIGALGIGIVLSMFQRDRGWEEVQKIKGKIENQEQMLSRIEQAAKGGAQPAGVAELHEQLQQLNARLDAVAAAAQSGSIKATDLSNAGGPAASGQPEWARPDVPVKSFPTRTFATDPRTLPGYRTGGEFTEVYEAQTKKITPNISTDVYARRIQEMVLESLADLDPKTLRLRGQLADAWQTDPEGLWMRAHLRAGVRFSDGAPVTAEDVRWTFHEYLMNEQIDAERDRSTLRDSIKKVEVIDDRTVEFSFVQRLFINEENALTIFVLPKHILSKLTPSQINQSTGLLVGSGPFRIKGFDVNNQWAPPADVVLERNEQYWGPPPALAGLRYQAINEEVARLTAFSSGDAQMITPSAPQFVAKKNDETWKNKAQFLNWVNMRSGYTFIAWNCGERDGALTPFHDRRVRLAMTYALDREKMIRDIWKGVGRVSNGMMNPDSPGANHDFEPWPFDQARAKKLLREAGWEDRDGNGVLEDVNGNEFSFQFSYAGGSEISEQISRFVKDSYQAIGIKVDLRAAEWTVYQDYLKKRDFDAITLGWGANGPESDPKQIYHSDSIKNQGDNFVQWSNAEADRIIDEGRREMDFDKRQEWWRKLEAVLHDEQPYTFVRVPAWLRFASPAVSNVNTYPKGIQADEFFFGGPMLPSKGQ